MKKLLAFLMTLAMLASLAVLPASAEEARVYTSLYSSEVSTLNYLTSSTTWDYTPGANVVDTLIEYNNIGEIIPGLAETWEVSEDQLTWTFHLRQGQKWYDYTGAEVGEVTANDFVAAAKYVLTPEYDSSLEYMFEEANILNAAAYYAGEITDFAEVGVKAVDDYTLQYIVDKPTPYLLSCLTYGSFMPAYGPQLEELGAEFATACEKMYYCGAFILSEFEPQVKHVFVKNPNNWDAEHVYIDRIEQIYNTEAATLAPTMALRGEVDYADLSNDIIDDWKANHADIVSRGRAVPDFSYFFCFNFDPQFDAAYEPENWKIAVNNENFRQSIMAGLDRVKAKTVIEPDNPEDLIWDTVTPADIVVYDGKDYTEMGDLADVKVEFNEEKAKEYRDAAIAELTAAGATLPVKVLMCYNPSDSSWAEECQVIEQQLEGLLGSDYIDVVVEPGPSSGFLKEIRRSGKYAFMKCNWGLDFADPINTCEPFRRTDNYGFLVKATQESLYDDNGEMTYYNLTDAAREMSGSDMEARYLAYAKAEAYLINHALTIPYGSNTGGYTASRLNPFEGQFAATGLATCRYKGQHLLEKPMSTDEYYDAYDEWLEKRAELAAK